MVYWSGHDTGFAILSTVAVPDLAIVKGAFAPGDLPGWALALVVSEVVAGRPADDETRLAPGQFPEPGGASETPIKDMDHLLLPALGALGQQHSRLLSAVAGQGAATGPPAHGGQGGRTRHLYVAYAAQIGQSVRRV